MQDMGKTDVGDYTTSNIYYLRVAPLVCGPIAVCY